LRSGLSEFFALVKDFKHIQSLAFKGMVVLPLASIWLKLGPPTSDITDAFLSITELVLLICVFQMWYRKPVGQLRRRFKVSTGLFFVALLGIVYFSQFYTVQIGETKNRIIVGSKIRDDVSPLLGPSYTTLDALRDSEYDPTRVWTTNSVHLISVLFELDWLLALAMFTISVSTFAMLQRRQ